MNPFISALPNSFQNSFNQSSFKYERASKANSFPQNGESGIPKDLIPETDGKSKQSDFMAIINENHLESSLIGKEPWPQDVKLYQPYETEQILLPDNANCLAVQAFLKMCNLNYQVEYKANAENMSPSGRVPFIKCGAFLVSELEPIVNFVANKGISLTSHLDGHQKSDMRAYISLVNTVLGNAENYITWVDSTTYSKVTKPRYGSVHPFPLNHILSFVKRQSIAKKLSALGWYNKTLQEVYASVEQCCQALSHRLESQDYFFGDKPCEFDATVFSHVYAILTNPGFPAGLGLAQVIRSHLMLLQHCQRLMPYLLLEGKIEEPSQHPLYSQQVKSSPREEGELSEFAYVDDEDEEDTHLITITDSERPNFETREPASNEYSIYD